MADDTGGATPDRTRERMAIVCTNAADIRADLLGSEGDDAALERVLAAAREGQGVACALDALHATLQAGGDAQGVYGYAGGGGLTRSPRAVGTGRDHSDDIVYLCPLNRCSRYSWLREETLVPSCVVKGQALVRDRL
ncbi:hypothetical protein [Streptomyces sp. cmx-18-6]|uniref:hypothetical protein n=1 Tax=Streptomyces sp. cmx-18-6 TaxID=2790930 RepID=UPI003981559E